MSKVVYLNGSFVDYSEAVVPVKIAAFSLLTVSMRQCASAGESHCLRRAPGSPSSAEAIKLWIAVSAGADGRLGLWLTNECLDAVLYLQVTRGRFAQA